MCSSADVCDQFRRDTNFDHVLNGYPSEREHSADAISVSTLCSQQMSTTAEGGRLVVCFASPSMSSRPVRVSMERPRRFTSGVVVSTERRDALSVYAKRCVMPA
eukprot:490963-Prymnesium_polylepis.1